FSVKRVPCSIPNVCVVDLLIDLPIRVIGIYAPENWADMCFLAPIRPDTNTSLRSERTIDYAFTIGVPLSVQALEVGTTSDHKPVLATVTCSAADYYEKLFVEPTVYRPHPYLDLQRPIEWENESEVIPLITFPELIKVVNSMKAKHSCDAHGISPHMLQFIPLEFWSLLLKLFNKTFIDFDLVSFWKEVRIILLAKKEAVCAVSGTRPISLLDTFLKVLERLFLVRFQIILQGRGILPDTQSGFRPGFRLQTRVLTLVEQISSYMANSAPVATVFVDFKSAFDQLWWEGCIGKLAQLGIPRSYRQWIVTWLKGRRAFLEVNGSRSRWFNVCRGGPQGGLSPLSIWAIGYRKSWGGDLCFLKR
ncbi:unnamed protein product, partial [Didymodactylos carnosus]